MIIQLNKDIQEGQREALLSKIAGIGYQSNPVKTQLGDYLVCIGKTEFDIRDVGHMPGVRDIHRVSDAHKLTSHKWKVERAEIDLGDGVKVSEKDFAMMAGPCSIEGEEQIRSTVEHLVRCGVKIMRGGVYKPRSSPYNFRGLGMDGLKIFHQICKENGVKVITEIMQVSQLEDMYPYVDIFQVGARNSQNFNLLDALGEVDKAVLIKRGISGTIDELLHSAEYIFSNGNEKLMLCERGIRTHEGAYRNTFDVNAIPILKEKTYLPVIADPSHGIGIRRFVEPVALASVAAGADGLLIEMHEKPEKALTDAAQTISYPEFSALMEKIARMRAALYG
jgi:3-deoxy-7-phosphoheptulonate synthase